MPERIDVDDINGYKMCIRVEEKWFTRELLGNRCWEPDTTKYISEHLGPGQVFVDAGAHIGYFTLLASGRVGPKGKVFAFEPDAESFEMLRHNVTLNHCSNVMAFRAALGSMDAPEMKLYGYGDPYQLYHTLSPKSMKEKIDRLDGKPIQPTGEFQMVELMKLDTAIPHKVDMIKIDVEGCESDVLAGAVEIIRENPEIIVIVEGNQDKWLFPHAFERKYVSVVENNRAYQRPKGAVKGTSGSLKVADTRRDPANDRPWRDKFTCFILGVPHTKTTMEHNCCAFTMKVEHWTDMMGARGHKIIHLGTEGSLPASFSECPTLKPLWNITAARSP